MRGLRNIGKLRTIGVLGENSGPSEINTVCPAITPTVTDLLVDGGMENWVSPTNLTSWNENVAGTSSVNREATIKRTGNYAARLDVDGSNSACNIYQSPTLAAETITYSEVYARTSVAAKTCYIGYTGRTKTFTPGSADWALCRAVLRSPSANAPLVMSRNAGTGSSIYLDDGKHQSVDFVSCLTLLGNLNHQSGAYICHPTLALNTWAGLVFCYQDANNFLVMYHDGTNAILEQKSAGVWTTLRTVAATYAANRPLAVYLDYPTAKLYYDGAQVGADATVTASLASLGFGVYGFNTFAGNAVGLVQTSSVSSNP